MSYGNQQHIPAKELIATMSAQLTCTAIACVTGVSAQTVRQIWELWQETGTVQQIPDKQWRHRLLNALDIVYLTGCIDQTPDIQLAELQAILYQECGILASEITISRALH
ncbi:hypothetical protein SERLA73DRAFT_43552 [Serpula lacrymans var. lacrymans S7.3]|uniref:Uncharacterized protein n=2 Tax=Serpula lacrymans var. lacrymans TaxID=341189 RepID=F8PI47_SERL3|nr:uncharacterized protein SERLADRAFT_432052 [Serpula lacrymans var. lacrymans S7.9]EGO04625.1 hypothetical protein SERLA73DRAFT_43552 [Serpula lacrymans var. lacrymans S7.3]EGO30488.1 hypothetical protein SERLADRAFT_432052 [Serpula lacrymans var. lacrymans S7.9]